MSSSFLADRAAYDDAVNLIRDHGEDAARIAGQRARESQKKDNYLHFAHWRQTARVIGQLGDTNVSGSIH